MLLEEVRRRLVIQQFWFAGDSWDVCGPTYIKCNGWHWLLPCKGTRGDFQPVLALGLGLVLALDVIPSLFVKHEHTSLEWTRFMRFGFCMHAVARCRCFRRWMWCSLRHAHTNVLLQNVCVCWLLCQPKNVAKKIHHTYEKHNETHLRSFTLKSVGKNVFTCWFLQSSNSRLPPLAMAQVRAGHVVPWLRLLQGPKGFKWQATGVVTHSFLEGPFPWWLQTRWHEFVPTWVPGEILRQPWPLQARSWVPAIPSQQFRTYWILLVVWPL